MDGGSGIRKRWVSERAGASGCDDADGSETVRQGFGIDSAGMLVEFIHTTQTPGKTELGNEQHKWSRSTYADRQFSARTRDPRVEEEVVHDVLDDVAVEQVQLQHGCRGVAVDGMGR